MPHQPGSAYPTSTLPPDPYQKLPLSGAPSFTAEPQEMPALQQTSMPSVQLSLVSQDHQQSQAPPPPIRTQFATYSSAPPPHLSLSAPSAADNSLNVPRYVDSNPRPSKSPRHASHQSVHSAGSISADTASGEYRYGPSTGYAGSSELSPGSAPPPSSAQAPYGSAPADNGGSASAGSGNAASAGPAGPPRDYFPPSQSWTTTAGETPTGGVAYNGAGAAGGDRWKAPGEPPSHGHSGQYGVHYAWNAT